MSRLMTRLGPDDLQLLASDGLLKGFGFNARERNCLFVNGGGGRFVEAGYPLGVDLDFEERGVAVGDLDLDGGLDLVVRSVARQKLIYLHNEAGWRGRTLRVELVGTESNRDAVGAVARIVAGGLLQVRVRSAGSGFQAQSESTLHFGLGAAERVDELTVRWPSGRRETFHDLPAGHLARIVEGEGRVTLTPLPGLPGEAPETPETPEMAEGPRAVPTGWRAWTPDGKPFALAAGRPAVVSLWASWCIPCAAEVPELGELKRRLGDAAQVVGISFEPDPKAARGFIDRTKPQYPMLLSDPQALAPLLETAFGDGAVPLPAAVVLDASGAVVRVLTGKLTADGLEREVRRVLERRP